MKRKKVVHNRSAAALATSTNPELLPETKDNNYGLRLAILATSRQTEATNIRSRVSNNHLHTISKPSALTKQP